MTDLEKAKKVEDIALNEFISESADLVQSLKTGRPVWLNTKDFLTISTTGVVYILQRVKGKCGKCSRITVKEEVAWLLEIVGIMLTESAVLIELINNAEIMRKQWTSWNKHLTS